MTLPCWTLDLQTPPVKHDGSRHGNAAFAAETSKNVQTQVTNPVHQLPDVEQSEEPRGPHPHVRRMRNTHRERKRPFRSPPVLPEQGQRVRQQKVRGLQGLHEEHRQVRAQLRGKVSFLAERTCSSALQEVVHPHLPLPGGVRLQCARRFALRHRRGHSRGPRTSGNRARAPSVCPQRSGNCI